MNLFKTIMTLVKVISFLNCLPEFKIGNLFFHVPSELRYHVYKDYVAELAQNIKTGVFNPVKNADGIAKPFLESSGILEQLATQLDQIITNNYATAIQQNFNSSKKKEQELFSAIEGKIEIEVEQFANHNGSFQLAADKEMTEVVNLIKNKVGLLVKAGYENYIAYIKATLEVVDPDSALIRALYLDNDTDWVLNKIWPASADPHKNHLAVSFLEFGKPGQPNRIVIFKPSSLLVDFAILGNLEAFCAIKEKYFSHICQKLKQSYFEIANANINYGPKKLKEYKQINLQTLKVLPIEDWANLENTGERLKTVHGYVEFIPSDFSLCNDNRLTIYAELEAMAERKGSTDIDQLLNDLQVERLQKHGDLLNEKSDQYNYYWTAKGILFGLLYLVRSADIHKDNVLSAFGKPWAIDLEGSLVLESTPPKKNALGHEASTCRLENFLFQAKTGLLFGSELEGLDASNAVSIQAVKPMVRNFGQASNLNTQPRKVANIELEWGDFKEGTEIALEGFKENLAEFRQWLGSEIVNNLLIREIPFATAYFYDIRDKLQNSTPTFLQIYKDANKALAMKINDKSLSLESRKYYFMTRQIFTEKLQQDLKQKLIPSFYIHVRQNEIFSNDGAAVKASKHIANDQELMKMPYADKTPIEIITKFWQRIENDNVEEYTKAFDDILYNQHLI